MAKLDMKNKPVNPLPSFVDEQNYQTLGTYIPVIAIIIFF